MRVRRTPSCARVSPVWIALVAIGLWLGGCTQSTQEEQPAPSPVMPQEGMEEAPAMKTPTATGEMTPQPAQATPEAPAMTPATTPAPTPAAMGNSSEEPNTGANAVEVNLKEFVIEMPKTLPPGPTTFNIRNTGTFQHNLEIEGQGVEKKLAVNLNAGEQSTLEVDLKPGEYHVYCPVGKHEERGMTLQLTVAAQ